MSSIPALIVANLPAAKPAGSRTKAGALSEQSASSKTKEAPESEGPESLPLVEAPPAAKGFELLQSAPWTTHPLSRALESMAEETKVAGRSLSDRLPSMLARQPYDNGWTASIVLFGHRDSLSSRFEIAPMSPGGGLRDSSIMAYHNGEEANSILLALKALPSFDAHLRQALSQGRLDEAQAILDAAAQSHGPLAFNGRSEELAGFPSYAEEAIGSESEMNIAFATEAWLALLRAGFAFDAEDFESAVDRHLGQSYDHDLNEEQMKASSVELAQNMFAPVLQADAAAGGSLGARISSEVKPSFSFIIASAIAFYEANAVDQAARPSAPSKRRIGIRSGL